MVKHSMPISVITNQAQAVGDRHEVEIRNRMNIL